MSVTHLLLLARKLRRGCALLLLPLAAHAQAGPPATVLRLGEPAPPLRYSTWLKGKPVTVFQPGKIYVVEFWATWCGYCIKAMPHLSELSKQYAQDVEFVGVDVLEKAPWGKDKVAYNQAKVAAFITTGQGKAMTYGVCRDTKDEYMANGWVSAQSLYGPNMMGIPFTVVIGRDGNVAWVGNPGVENKLDQALAQLVANTYDTQAFIKECQQQKAAYAQGLQAAEAKRTQAATVPALQPMQEALAAARYDAALRAAYAAIAQDAALYKASYLPRIKAFRGLAKSNPDQALQLLELERQAAPARADTTHRFLKDVATDIGQDGATDARFYPFIITTLQGAYEDKVMMVRQLKVLAAAYYQTGNRPMAQKIMQKLADTAKGSGQNPAEYEQLLAKYQAK